MPVTLVRSLITAPRILAPLASAAVRSVGLARPSPGSQSAPARSETSMIGYISAARAGLISSHSRPNASAVAAVRRSDIIRSLVRATVTPPHRRNPVASPVSASSRSYSAVEYCTSLVPLSDARSCPTSPAACQVVPQDSWPCSSSSTSVRPRRVRW